MGVNNSKTNEMSSIENTSNKESVSIKEFNKTAPFSFSAKNYRFLLIGLGINLLGFVLMIGGATDDPAKFDASELFSHTRITIAPILIVTGYIIIAYAIMKKPKVNSK